MRFLLPRLRDQSPKQERNVGTNFILPWCPCRERIQASIEAQNEKFGVKVVRLASTK